MGITFSNAFNNSGAMGKEQGMKPLMTKLGTMIGGLILAFSALVLAGCGGGGNSPGVSSQVVTGTAAVGTQLSGQVTLKDASTPSKQKTAVIGSDGSFAFDVTGMKAPFIIQATGSANGQNHTLLSFASGTGIANANPLSHALVTLAWGGANSGDVFTNPDEQKLRKIQDGLTAATQDLLMMLNPLLDLYGAAGKNPISSPYRADHSGLDGMFDFVTVDITGGTLTVSNRGTNAPIFSCAINNINSGTFNANNMPHRMTVPAAPTNLTAVGGAGQLTLTWSAVSNAASYTIYYATTSGVTPANGIKVANATSPAVLSGLADATTYYCVVTAVNSAGESVASTQATATTNVAAPVIPAAPGGLIATGGTRQVSLSWSAVSNATSYNVYYATSNGVTKVNGTKVSNATSPLVLNGLADATSYYCIVTAVNSAGESAASVQAAATTLPSTPPPALPATPSNLVAAGGTNQITLSWSAASNATSYNLYWSAASGVTTATGTKVSGVTSPYVKTGLAAGTTYYFVVTAVNSVGESSASAQASATTSAPPPTVPAAPTGVTATGGANQVSLAWSAVSGATSYNLYWSTASGVTKVNGTKLTNVTSPYLHSGLAAGTSYYYIVTAVNSTGEGAASAQVSATTSAPSLSCGTCHAIPPQLGQHDFHSGVGIGCVTCHGSGYSTTTVNAATHMNGVKDLSATIGWNAAGRNCTNSCHGRKTW